MRWQTMLKAEDVRLKATTGEIISVIRISAHPEKRREFFLTISSLLDSIKREEGCRDCRFYEEAGDHDSFLLVGEWNTGADYYRHASSEQFAVLQGALKVLSQQKHLDFRLLSRIDGIEPFATLQT